MNEKYNKVKQKAPRVPF